MEVCVSGATFAHFLKTLKEEPGDAEGFICGALHKESYEEISDSTETSKRHAVVINIHSFVCLGRKLSFYSALGKVDYSKLEELAHDHQKELSNLIGWFSYRRGSHHILSMRERAVHNSLVTMVTHIPREHLLALLITSQVNTSLSLHSEHHTLFCLRQDLLKGTPLTISNLHSTSSVVYRRGLSNLVGRDQVEVLAQTHRDPLVSRGNPSGPPVDALRQDTLQYILELKRQVVASGEGLVELEASVSRLREQVATQRAAETAAAEERQRRLEAARVAGLVPPVNGEAAGPLVQPSMGSVLDDFDPLLP